MATNTSGIESNQGTAERDFNASETAPNRTTTNNGDTTNRDTIGIDNFGSGEPTKPKRGRGRPRKNNEENPQGNTTRKTPKQTKQDVDKQAEKASQFVLSTLQLVSAALLQKDTSFTDVEMLFIEPSLTAVLKDMDTAVMDRYSKIINPLVLIAGLAMWGIRIAPRNHETEVTENDNVPATIFQETTANVQDVSGNGYSGFA